MSGDEADIFFIPTASVYPGDNLAAHHDGAGGVPIALLGICHYGFPHQFPGPCVHGNDVSVIGGSENFVAVDGDIALDTPDDAASWGRHLPLLGLVLPDQVSGGGIQCLNYAVWIWQYMMPS